MLKVSEVYEKQIKEVNERPDGTEYSTFSTSFDTREALINTDYVVSVQPYSFGSSRELDKLEQTFPEGTKFSLFIMDGNSFRRSEIIVVGSFDKFCRILKENN